MIENILFDCDGTLVSSEELAFSACTVVVNETLEKMGVEIRFTPQALMERFVGKVFWRIITELAVEHGFEIDQIELDKLIEAEQNAVIAKLAAEVLACDGVNDALVELDNNYEMAVVSSSALPRLRACLLKAGQDAYFADEHVFSAASSLSVPTSKPEPTIYLHAMEQLGTSADKCVAVEDSCTGVLSAVKAGIQCIGYVGAYAAAEHAERSKQLLEAGATVVIEHWCEFLDVLASLDN